jgi:exosome complex component RRP45
MMAARLLTPLRLVDRLSTNEREFVLHAAKVKHLRVDGRTLKQARKCALRVRRVSQTNSLAECQLGQTRVSCIVSAELVAPYPDRPGEGFLLVTSETMPCASPGDSSTQLLHLVEKSLRDSRALDVEGLCVAAGIKVWAVRCQLVVECDGGSVVDAASLAALAALTHFRRPEVSVVGETVTVHGLDDKTPVALAIHHVPLCVTLGFILEEDRTSALLLVDPTHVEEKACVGMVTVVLNAHQEICGWHKTGAALSVESVKQAVDLAVDERRSRAGLLEDAVLAEPF